MTSKTASTEWKNSDSSPPKSRWKSRTPTDRTPCAWGPNSALGDQVFLQVGGSEVIYAVKPDILKLIPLSKDLWRDTTLVRLENVPFDVISVRSGPKAFELQRDSQGLWRFRKPLQQARADTQKIETLLAQLQSLRVTNFVTDAASPDLEPYGFPAATQVLAPGFRLSLLQNTNTTPLFELPNRRQPDQPSRARLCATLEPGATSF